MALPRFFARILRPPQKKAGFTQVVVVLSVIVFLLGSSAVAAYYFPNNPLVKTGKKILASVPLLFWSSNPPSTEANTSSPSPTITSESKQSDSLTVPPALLEEDTANLRSPVPILGSNLSLDTNTASSVIYSIMAGTGIAVSAGQHPTITNTGVLSVGGKFGTVYIDENGLKFDGNKLYNADKGSSQNIIKAIKVDGKVDVKADSNSTDLYLVAGTGMEIDTNNTEKTITFNGKAGWIDDGSIVRTLTDTDKVGIGTSNPTSLFSVGDSSEFQVNSSGNIVKINNVAYSFPSSQGSASSLLQNDGSGGLTWATVGASAITPDSLDFSEFKDVMTLDAATTIAQAGYNFAFSGSGNVGVGTTTPNYRLDIAGTGRFTGNLILDSLTSGSTDTVVTHSSGTLQTRTIDSRAWGSTLTDGSGVASYVARWSDANTLSNGVLYDNGTNVGIGTTSPSYKLHISGSGATYTLIEGSEGGILFKETDQAVDEKLWGLGSFGKTLYGYTRNDADTGSTHWLQVARGTGTAISSISFPNGNFGIGTASPAGLFDVNGKLTVLTGGNVGIGTTTPLARFNVVGNGTYAGIFTSGNVGIGTTSPGVALDVVGSSRVTTSTDSTTSFQVIKSNTAKTFIVDTTNGRIGSGDLGAFAPSSSLHIQRSGAVSASFDSTGNTLDFLVGSVLSRISSSGTRPLYLNVNSTDLVTLDGSSQSVGIGTLSPASKLHVVGNGTNAAVFMSGNVGIGTTSPSAKLDVAGTAWLRGGTGNTGVFVDATGNVGIGTTAPDNTLTLFGANANIRLISTANGANGMYIGNGSFTTGQYAIYTSTNSDLQFGTNSTANMIIKSGGNVGIGTVSPAGLLDVNGKLTVLSGGNVGIGTTAPAQLFHVQRSGAGVVARFTDSDGSCDIDPITTSMSCSSDIRLKKDITTIPNALEKVEALRGVNYKWKTQADDTLRIGFVAQEVEPIVPELVGTDEYGMKSVRYTNFAPLLVNAIKELDEKKLNRDEIALFQAKTTPSPTSTPFATPTLSPTPSDNPSLFESLLTRLKDAIFGTAAVFQKTVAFLGEVTFDNRVIFADKDMAGFAIISKDKQEVTITFQKPYINKPVVNLTNDGHTTPAFVKNVSPQSFTIQIPAPAAQDLAFNWIAITHKDPQTTRSSEEHIVSPIAETTPTPTQPPSVSEAKEFVTPTPSFEPQKQEEASSSASLQSTTPDSPKAPSNTPTPTLSQSNFNASESASIR